MLGVSLDLMNLMYNESFIPEDATVNKERNIRIS